ncbi:MAG: molecular chaperone DnaJ [Nanoarchaeota archaeon]
MAKRDYYEILSIAKNAGKDEIKSAYKKLAKQYHPDVSKEPKSAEKFKEVSEAYAVLSDDQKRAQYDQFGHEGFDQRFSQEDIFRDFDFDIFRENGFGAFDSIFDMFFGGSRGGKRKQRGRDLQYDAKITLEEAAFGVEKKISVPRHEACAECDGTGAAKGGLETCSVCHGRGQVQSTKRTPFGMFSYVGACSECGGEGKRIIKPCAICGGEGIVKKEREISVNIPAGVDNGNMIRLSGEGEMSADHVAGDLYVVTHIIPHKDFEREHDDILLERKISITQAIFGTKMAVPTLYGEADLTIPVGTQSHTTFRLKNMGMPRLQKSGKGDQFVKIIVEIPAKLTKKQKELLEAYAAESGEGREKKGFFKKILE